MSLVCGCVDVECAGWYSVVSGSGPVCAPRLLVWCMCEISVSVSFGVDVMPEVLTHEVSLGMSVWSADLGLDLASSAGYNLGSE